MPKLYPSVLKSAVGTLNTKAEPVQQVPTYEDQGVRYQAFSKGRDVRGTVFLNSQARYHLRYTLRNDPAVTATITFTGEVLYITRVFIQHNSQGADDEIVICPLVSVPDDSLFYYSIFAGQVNQQGSFFHFDPPLEFSDTFAVRAPSTGAAETIRIQIWGYKEKKI